MDRQQSADSARKIAAGRLPERAQKRARRARSAHGRRLLYFILEELYEREESQSCENRENRMTYTVKKNS